MTTGLYRFRKPAPPVAPGEQCEMCAESIDERHGHVIDLQSRSIMCTCRGCYLLFTHSGAGGMRHRSVPERYLHRATFEQGEALLESIGVPVGMAFLFHNSELDQALAFYPSPAGATEAELRSDAWSEVLASAAGLSTIEPDVEALLVNKVEGAYECFIAPIDACYQLVGLVRLHWRGFDGGSEAAEAIDEFFANLRERSRPLEAGDD